MRLYGSAMLFAGLLITTLPAYAQEGEAEVDTGSPEVEVQMGEEEYQEEALVGSAHVARPFWLEARGGITIPTADFADVVEVGFGLGGSVGVYISPAFTIFGNLDWGTLSGVTEEDIAEDLPDQRLLNYYLAFGYDLAWSVPTFDFLLFAGAGGTTFYVDDVDGSETNFALNLGLKLNMWFSPNVGIVLHGGADLVFLTDELQQVDDADTRWLFPVQLGVAFRF